MDQSSTPTFNNSIPRLFQDIPRLSKTIAGVLGFFLVLGSLFGKYTADYFTINVAYIAPPYFFLWTLVTAGLYDFNLIGGIINILILLMSGKYLEPVWGSTEFLKFILVVNVFSGLSSFFTCLFLYSFIANEIILYKTYICGFSGVIAAFTVALKQLAPEQEIPIFFTTIRAKHLPSVVLLFNSILLLLGIHSFSFLMVLYGILVGWIYLRFYQFKGGVRGDLSESFAFATFFPEAIQPLIKTISTIVYKILTKVKLCPIGGGGSSRGSDNSVLPSFNVNNSNSGGGFLGSSNNTQVSSLDIDRRKALAMKALEQRMSMNEQQQQQQQQHQLPPPPTSSNITNI